MAGILDYINTGANAINGVGTAINTVKSLFGGNSSGMNENLKLMREQNKFNAEQAELNRQFQSEQADVARQWSLDMWQRNNEYNTPQQEMLRKKAAGLNPFTGEYVSNSPSPASSPASGVSGGQASGVTPPYSPMTPSSSLGQFREIAETMRALSESGQANASTKSILSKLPAEMQKLFSETALNKVNTQLQSIVAKWSNKQQKAAYEKVYAEINNFKKQVELADSEIEVNKIRKEQLEALRQNLFAQMRLTDTQEAMLLRYFTEYYDDEVEARIASIKSGTTLNHSKAREAESNADLADEKVLTEGTVRELNRSKASLNAAEQQTEDELRPSRVNRSENNQGAENDSQALYTAALEISGGNRAAARYVQAIFATLHEGENLAEVITDVYKTLTSMGVDKSAASSITNTLQRTVTSSGRVKVTSTHKVVKKG